MRLGDYVINKNDSANFIFQITGFEGDKVILKLIDLPLTTVLPINCLIRVSHKKKTKYPLKVIKGGVN